MIRMTRVDDAHCFGISRSADNQIQERNYDASPILQANRESLSDAGSEFDNLLPGGPCRRFGTKVSVLSVICK
jgi:hypothetical protein